jgi:hypothetical protein
MAKKREQEQPQEPVEKLSWREAAAKAVQSLDGDTELSDLADVLFAELLAA